MTDQNGDDDLGTELRGLPVPEHRPGFWERLDRRLEAEDAVTDRRARRPASEVPRLSPLARYAPLVIAAIIVVLIVVLVAL